MRLVFVTCVKLGKENGMGWDGRGRRGGELTFMVLMYHPHTSLSLSLLTFASNPPSPIHPFTNPALRSHHIFPFLHKYPHPSNFCESISCDVSISEFLHLYLKKEKKKLGCGSEF